MNINQELITKYAHLKQLLTDMGKVAIAFSGGVDSTFLLKVAVDQLGRENVLAVTSQSETYPQKQLEEARQLAITIGAQHDVIYTSELNNQDFAKNDKHRCYYCKKELFTHVKEVAAAKGINVVLDGSNHDDEVNDYRPGLKAVAELGVRSPLKEAKLTKQEIRTLSKELNLPTWDKPAFACLSSRFPYGDPITQAKVTMVGQAEEFLQEYPFKQLRVRHHDSVTARIEVLPDDMPRLLQHRDEIVTKFKEIGYKYVTMDIQGYRTGSMNEVL